MQVIPAIDLKEGQCVRLNQGRFDQVSAYSKDPVHMARYFEDLGARNLHIVDLDGAKQSDMAQFELISAIRRATRMTIQVGGGIKSQHKIRALLDLGINRVVLGSIAVADMALTRSFIQTFGAERIVLALDVRLDAAGNPLVATHGWQHSSDMNLFTLLQNYEQEALSHVLCTDIDRDGMLTSPNFELYRRCIKAFPAIRFQASGGVTTLNDLVNLRRNQVAAVIIGKAIYENRLSLDEALYVDGDR